MVMVVVWTPTPLLKFFKLQGGFNGFQWIKWQVAGVLGGVTPGVVAPLCALRADWDGRGAQFPPARIACRGLPGSGVPPGLDFKPNKLVFVVLAQSCPFLDCRTSFERRLDSIGQLLAIIDL
ncbi:hypothetical protein E3N88_46150 [Mikania micrantha]|uniref:Uncharacterized protein n=1 Tax=Mikania micrantha TaxID=192012 RepID=A0A5N6L746_9ASTR|nr:hypothetical protein E3N88_46150 [Mikania micrantha]